MILFRREWFDMIPLSVLLVSLKRYRNREEASWTTAAAAELTMTTDPL